MISFNREVEWMFPWWAASWKINKAWKINRVYGTAHSKYSIINIFWMKKLTTNYAITIADRKMKQKEEHSRTENMWCQNWEHGANQTPITQPVVRRWAAWWKEDLPLTPHFLVRHHSVEWASPQVYRHTWLDVRQGLIPLKLGLHIAGDARATFGVPRASGCMSSPAVWRPQSFPPRCWKDTH